MRLTRRYRFSASHRLHANPLSDVENERMYGKCNNPYGHGHDYLIEVAVRGRVDEDGRVVDLDRLDALVRREIVDAFEHKNLNLDIPEFADCVPTAENIAAEAARRLQNVWSFQFADGPALDSVRIHETPRNIFELKL